MPKPAKEKRPPCISSSLQKTGSLVLQYMKFTLTSSFAYPTQYKNLQDSLKKQADWVWEKREGGRNRPLTSAQLHTNVYEVQKFAAELFFFSNRVSVVQAGLKPAAQLRVVTSFYLYFGSHHMPSFALLEIKPRVLRILGKFYWLGYIPAPEHSFDCLPLTNENHGLDLRSPMWCQLFSLVSQATVILL